MLYKINSKYYIKVGGYYKEVNVTSQSGNLDIKPITDKNARIEVSRAKNVVIVNPKKENFNKNVEKETKTKIDKKW